MKIRKSLVLAVIMLVSMLTFFGCPKKAEVTMTPEVQKEETQTEEERAAAERKAEEERLAAEAKAREEAEAQERAAAEAAAKAAGLKPIYFDFDKYYVRDDARVVMKENADWLKARPDVKVRIEGNADERGTIEYNQALGQRRAASAKKYLTDLGISSKRISIISYGKEKPVCAESTEECWQRNRRAELAAE